MAMTPPHCFIKAAKSCFMATMSRAAIFLRWASLSLNPSAGMRKKSSAFALGAQGREINMPVNVSDFSDVHDLVGDIPELGDLAHVRRRLVRVSGDRGIWKISRISRVPGHFRH